MTAHKPHYNFKNERVHLVNLFDPEKTHVRCFRCRRDLPLDKFEPMFGFRSQYESKVPLRRGIQALHPLCFTCRKQQRGEWVSHPLYTPSLDRFWQEAVKKSKAGANARGLVFAISKDDALGMYLRQEGKCALSGVPLVFREKGSADRSRRSRFLPSLDRIDSHGNYTINNVQVVAAIINVMKNDLSTDDFIGLCERVAGQRLASWV